MARLRCAVALARPLRRAPQSTAPKGLREKCPAAALRASSNRTGVRPSSRALHLSTFRANAAPSGFCISLLSVQRFLIFPFAVHPQPVGGILRNVRLCNPRVSFYDVGAFPRIRRLRDQLE